LGHALGCEGAHGEDDGHRGEGQGGGLEVDPVTPFQACKDDWKFVSRKIILI
jgi:hypothetical protein